MNANIIIYKKNNIKKICKFIEKNWIIILIIPIVLRIFLSCRLPSFYLGNLRYDDRLMLNYSTYLIQGKYLGNYCDLALVKGIIYPIFLSVVRLINVPSTTALTLLYILACLFFINSMKKIINNKTILILIFIILLFNPISYSSDAFQRLYRNSIAYTELLFFFGIIIRIICSKKNNIISYIALGVIMSIMLLTKEDNIWAYIVLIIIFIYKLHKNLSIKSIIINLIPVILIILNLNIVSYINYTKYGIYTYDELRKSSFKQAYIKILQIKDDEKIDNVAIPKSTFYKLAENSKVFNFTKKQIDNRYSMILKGDGKEITNGDIVWYLRSWIYQNNYFQDGKEAEEYYKKLSDDIENLFQEGKLEREFTIPSIHINTPTINELKELPKNLIKSIWYTSSYKNIKSFSDKELSKEFEYNDKIKAYSVSYTDYHNAENIIENNILCCEIIKQIYKYSTIVFSIVALIIYIKNIKTKDKLNLILHIILFTYLIILCGVVYTHTTAFSAIRYCYLCNIYILQNLFIVLNLYRIYDKKNSKEKKIKLLGSGIKL